MATPVIREIASASGAPSAPVSAVTTTAVKAGDVLLAIQGHDYGTSAQMLAPTGSGEGTWTLRAQGNTATNNRHHLNLWYRTVTEGGAQTTTDNGAASSSDITLVVVVLDGSTLHAEWLDAVAITGALQASSTSQSAPQVTPTGADDVLLTVHQAAAGPYTHSAPSGMTLARAATSRAYLTTTVHRQTLAAAGATGVRTSTGSAASVWLAATIAIRGAAPPLPAIGPVDAFGSGLALWPRSYGGPTDTGGRGRVPSRVPPNYTGLESAPLGVPFTGRRLLFQVPTVAPVNGATTGKVQTAGYVVSATAGSRIGFEYDARTNVLAFVAQEGYYDPNAAASSITYSATTHQWWAVEHTGSTIRWETSPDGLTWVTRRVLATPPDWTTATDLRVALESYRDSGAEAFAEFDNVNVPPGTATVAAGRARSRATGSGRARGTRVRAGRGRGRATGSGRGRVRRVSPALRARGRASASGEGHPDLVRRLLAAGRASARAEGDGDPLSVARARARATASGEGDPDPVRRARARARATAAGRFRTVALRALRARGRASARGRLRARLVRAARARATARALAAAHLARVARAATSSRAGSTARAALDRVVPAAALAAVASSGSALAGGARALVARAGARARGLVEDLTRVTTSSAAERAGTVAGGLLRAITPASAHEDATGSPSATASATGRPPSSGAASSAAAAAPRRVVPLSARESSTARSASVALAVGRPGAVALAPSDASAGPSRVGRQAAAAAVAGLGAVGGGARAIRLRAVASARGASSSIGRAVGSTSSRATSSGTSSPTADAIAPVEARSRFSSRAATHALAAFAGRALAEDLASSESTPRLVDPSGTAHAAAQGNGDALARVVGRPGAHGRARTAQGALWLRVRRLRARARARASGGITAGSYTGALHATGTASAEGLVTRAVDVPGRLDTGARPNALDATARPTDLVADAARPNRLEATIS